MIKILTRPVKAFVKATLDLVFPNSCAVCSIFVERQHLTCFECLKKLGRLGSKIVGKEPDTLEVFSRFSYSEETKKFVYGKYRYDPSTFLKAGRLLLSSWGLQETLFSKKMLEWVIVPVPLYWTRQFIRGFNQSQMLATGFAQESRFKVLNLLSKNKSTLPQVQMQTKMERKNNVLGTFSLNTFPLLGRTRKSIKENIRGKGIVLVDDIVTTGSTLLECRKVLMSLSPEKIIAVTLCRS